MKQEKTYSTIEQVRRNVIKSILLVLGLVVFIMAISLGIGYYLGDLRSGIIWGAVVTVIVIPIQMLSAKAAILGMTHGKKADPSIDSQRILLSKVEGLSIAAGLKRVPDVYIIPSAEPNAFASGMSEHDALIGVTEGLLKMMDEQELEGVIAHEMSHIVHRDIMLSQLTVSLVSIIIILSMIFSRLAFFGGRRGDDDNDSGGAGILAIVGLLAILLQPIARLIASFIQMSISRKREFAADAYGVRLCGYNEGLASALEKLGGIPPYTENDIKSLGGEQLKCMYIDFPEKKFSSIFSTHPPIEERIRILRNMY
ncbi:MAG: M48 family metallopeptidase [Clostridia bacterium]